MPPASRWTVPCERWHSAAISARVRPMASNPDIIALKCSDGMAGSMPQFQGFGYEGQTAKIRQAFLRDPAVVVSAQDRFAYLGMKYPAAPAGWGQGGAPDQMQLLMRAHRLSGDVAILRVMERAHHAVLGADQLGLSLISGAGLRPIGNPLHEGSLAMGIDAPAGMTIYRWAPQARTAYGWVFGPWWSPLPEGGDGRACRATPHRRASRCSIPNIWWSTRLRLCSRNTPSSSRSGRWRHLRFMSGAMRVGRLGGEIRCAVARGEGSFGDFAPHL